MSDQPTLKATTSTISSPDSEFGAPLCAAPAGQIADRSGRCPVLANLSARQAKAMDLLTSGTYGRPHFTLSSMNDLSALLESKLRPLTASLGSTLFKLTWKARATPSGRLIPALRGLARRTSVKGSIGWATPQARDHFPAHSLDYIAKKKLQGHGMANLNDQAMLASWPTTSVRDHKGGYHGGRIRDGKISTDTLDVTAQLATWPTPKATDGEKGGPNQKGSRGDLSMPSAAALTHWSTPKASDHQFEAVESKALRNAKHKAAGNTKGVGGLTLPMQGSLASWNTPAASDGQRGGKITPAMTGSSLTQQSQFAALSTDSGETPSGFPAGIPTYPEQLTGGPLNPAHSRWLMGLTSAWDSCAASAMRSLGRKRKDSVKS